MARKKKILSPTYTELIEPVFSVIKELGGSATNNEIRDKIIAFLNLPDNVVDEQHTGSASQRTELEYQLALRSPLAEKFIRTGKPVLTSDEIRPTDIVPVLAPNQSGKESAFPMKWGFNLPKGSLVVNARVETAATKPTFREAWERRRCVIPASWYYEWTHLTDRNGREVTGDKYMLQPQGDTMTWLAGLYRMEDGLPYFTILTRDATDELKFIHDRMPLIFPKEMISAWISPDHKPETILPYALSDMLAEKA